MGTNRISGTAEARVVIFYQHGASYAHVLAVVVCLCVCLSVTRRYCVKTAKRRIKQITPCDSPGTSFLTPTVVGYNTLALLSAFKRMYIYHIILYSQPQNLCCHLVFLKRPLCPASLVYLHYCTTFDPVNVTIRSPCPNHVILPF